MEFKLNGIRDCLIEGVEIHELKIISDHRGSVLHMMKCVENQIEIIKECYFSEITPGSIKAWKLHKKQTQNIAVPVGCIRIVIYDDREKSKSKGKKWVENLGRPNNYWRIKIPPNLWYGFYCTGISSALIINCTDTTHDPLESERLPVNNKIIPHGEDIFIR